MKILLPIDGSPASLAAVHHALDWVRQGLPASFVLANVQEPASLYEVVVGHDPQTIEDVRRAAGADLLAPAEALVEAAGLSYESEVAGGNPHHTLLDMAERYGCDAIVMGARNEGTGQVRLGSVAQAVLEHSPLPVTVVRAPEAIEAMADDADAGEGHATDEDADDDIGDEIRKGSS
jgi:nucleotide-binding universal stress UspA family protein